MILLSSVHCSWKRNVLEAFDLPRDRPKTHPGDTDLYLGSNKFSDQGSSSETYVMRLRGSLRVHTGLVESIVSVD